jgi:hypothetical protein
LKVDKGAHLHSKATKHKEKRKKNELGFLPRVGNTLTKTKNNN